VVGGQGICDRHAGVGAVEREPRVAERLHERDQVAGDGAGVVPVLRSAGEPDAALVRGDDLEGAGQRWHHETPGVPGLRPPVDEQQRRPLTAHDHVLPQIARIDVAALERVGEPRREVGREGGRAGAVRAGLAGGRRAHGVLPSDVMDVHFRAREASSSARPARTRVCPGLPRVSWPRGHGAPRDLGSVVTWGRPNRGRVARRAVLRAERAEGGAQLLATAHNQPATTIRATSSPGCSRTP
jgi:hypothetical protein